MVWSKAFGNNWHYCLCFSKTAEKITWNWKWVVCVQFLKNTVSCNFSAAVICTLIKQHRFSTKKVKTAVLTLFSKPKPKLIRKPWFFTKYQLEPNTVTGIGRNNRHSTNTNSVTVCHWSHKETDWKKSEHTKKDNYSASRSLYLQSWHRWRLCSNRCLWHGGETRLCTCSDTICLETQP